MTSLAPGSCPHCGALAGGQFKCPVCGRHLASSIGLGIRGARAADVLPISDVQEASLERIATGGAWDVAFNGGLVRSQSVIMTGEPGSGKTTLLLQKASRFAEVTSRFSYLISAEQSSGEVKLAVNRLKLPNPDRIIVLKNYGAGGELDEDLFKRYPPGMIVLDSLTALCGEDDRAAVVVAKRYKGYSIKHNAPSFVILQVNKSGDLAGRMKSAHDLDTIASMHPAEPRDPKRFQHGDWRKLELWKNRFGPRRTDASASWFEMTGEGFVDAPPEDKRRNLDDTVDYDHVMSKGTLEEVVLARQQLELEAKDAAGEYREMIAELRQREAKLAVEPPKRERTAAKRRKAS